MLFSSSVQAITLKDLLEQASKVRAETQIAKNEELRSEIEKNQLISAFYPVLTARQNNQFIDPVQFGGAVARFGEPFQATSAVNLRQPLFSGGAEWSVYQTARNLPKIAEKRAQIARLELLRRLSVPYLELRRLELEYPSVIEEQRALEEQVNLLKSWRRIGRARPAEILVAQSGLARLQAQTAMMKTAYKRALYELRNFQQSPNLWAQHEQHPFQVPLTEDPREDFKSLQRTADLSPMSELLRLESEQLENEKARLFAEYLPQVQLDANYYLQRAGILADSKWDANISITWELFRGRQTDRGRLMAQIQLENKIKEYKQELKTLEIQLKRNLEEEALIASELRALQEALKTADLAYRATRDEARQMLVAAVEVLRLSQDLAIIKRAVSQKTVELERVFVDRAILTGEAS